MLTALRGEERGFFRDAFRALEKTISSMPVTYGQDGLGDNAVVHLHYFCGAGDWWITEKDIVGGVDQAFGLVDLGNGPELGYISIRELLTLKAMNVDLHFEPQTLGELKAAKYGKKPAKPAAEKPGIVNPAVMDVCQVINPAKWFAEKPAGLVH